MTQTKTAMYDTRGAAETAREGLISLGIPDADISIRGTDAGGTSAAAPAATEDKGFWASLTDMFMPDEDKDTYSEGVRRGGFLLSARVPDALETEAEDVLEGADPVDLDERAATWRQDGWSGSGTAGATGAYASTGTTGTSAVDLAGSPTGAYGASSGAKSHSDPALTTDYTGTSGTGAVAATGGMAARDLDPDRDDTIELVEEDLKIGKRATEGGRVRVRTYMTERPVEEDVNLRSERVTIERRPVDRDVPVGTGAFQERSIEAVERGEEAIVSKTARVKEEISLHTDVENRTETVRDTVRSTDVEVDDDRTGHGLTTTDSELRQEPRKI